MDTMLFHILLFSLPPNFHCCRLRTGKYSNNESLNKRIMMLNIGDKAPDFTLFNQAEESIALSDFKGQQVIIWFFPKASTPG